LSKTLLSRLAMFEVLDAAGPLTISELAHRSGLDAAVVSRTVAACERDGWLIRSEGRVAIGPRATLLGHSGPFADVIARSAPLVHAVAGVTGMLTHAYSLVGSTAVLIAAAFGRGPSIPAGLAARAPLHATAAGLVIAAQLSPRQLDVLLPAEPYPDAAAIVASMAGTVAEPIFTPAPRGARAAAPELPRRRADLLARLDAVKEAGFADDSGALDPAISCIAAPWPQPGFPSALVCLGPPDAFAAAPLIRQALGLAAQPGSTPQQIITGTAAAITHASLPPWTTSSPADRKLERGAPGCAVELLLARRRSPDGGGGQPAAGSVVASGTVRRTVRVLAVERVAVVVL
jgi:DNA-binding IclR family transcriptional regulator